jgi:hypothetical protein
MPLIDTGKYRVAGRDAIKVWMRDENSEPSKIVLIFVTSEALYHLDPSSLRDPPDDARVFDANAELIKKNSERQI